MAHPNPPTLWRRLYTSDRLPTLRFVQALCLALSVVCLALLAMHLRQPHPDDATAAVAALCLAAALLPHAGMVWYLRRYVLAAEVADDALRLTLPRFFVGTWQQTLQRSEITGTQWRDPTGPRYHQVHAPWTWLRTTKGRFVVDAQGDGDVEVWVAGTPAPVALTAPLRRRRRKRRR